MLETFAVQYLLQDETVLTAIALGSFVVGALIAAVFVRSETDLPRAPYFAYIALMTFAVSAVQLVWLHAVLAIEGGYLWVLMAIDLSAAVAAGYFFCRIAIARSRNAYGHGRMAFLGFLPIANFWLLLTPPKDQGAI